MLLTEFLVYLIYTSVAFSANFYFEYLSKGIILIINKC